MCRSSSGWPGAGRFEDLRRDGDPALSGRVSVALLVIFGPEASLAFSARRLYHGCNCSDPGCFWLRTRVIVLLLSRHSRAETVEARLKVRRAEAIGISLLLVVRVRSCHRCPACFARADCCRKLTEPRDCRALPPNRLCGLLSASPAHRMKLCWSCKAQRTSVIAGPSIFKTDTTLSLRAASSSSSVQSRLRANLTSPRTPQTVSCS